MNDQLSMDSGWPDESLSIRTDNEGHFDPAPNGVGRNPLNMSSTPAAASVLTRGIITQRPPPPRKRTRTIHFKNEELKMINDQLRWTVDGRMYTLCGKTDDQGHFESRESRTYGMIEYEKSPKAWQHARTTQKKKTRTMYFKN